MYPLLVMVYFGEVGRLEIVSFITTLDDYRIRRDTGLIYEVVSKSARMFVSLILFVSLVLAWLTIMPVQLGGSCSYVVVSGVSMLPRYRGGDLVVLRREANYFVGEVVGYHNPQLKITIMHRIIAISDGKLTTKGDNNNFIDPFEPSLSQVVGVEWIHVSRAGLLLLLLRQPLIAGIFGAVVGVLAFGGQFVRRRRRHSFDEEARR